MNAAGLTASEAARRFAEAGPNELRRREATPAWRLLASQFTSFMVLLLVGACVVSVVLGETLDATAIGVIVALNGIVGFFQEYKAEHAIAALRSMTAPRARVVRDGAAQIIPAREVVAGDRLLLEEGDLVAADARLVEANELRINEALLTGESAPVEKSLGASPEGAPLAERHESVFLGTAVAAGSGAAEVVATGMATEMGKIANLLAGAESEETPLQRRLGQSGRMLVILCLGVVIVVAILGILRRDPWLDVLVSSVSLAVAAVPEGLPAIVTVALAIGVQRMAARNVMVRRLHSVETLGCATVICTDKTGTLTRGVMAVRDVWARDRRALLDAAAACSEAQLSTDGKSGTGDPTEVALLVAAAELGIARGEIERERPRVRVRPFSSERRRMSIARADGAIYLKGAVEAVLPRCTSETEGALAANAQMTERGLRVLAVAAGAGAEEAGLRLLGLVGIADPPRPEAIDAVARARAAGITTVMITGDHAGTARAIAREMGILGIGDDPNEVVHARATAEDKLKIVRNWKAKNAIVAMTGDGVNDAPAIREANIGIAMGISGTEVTREAADMVLADDNFASIVAAVREGRGIYENIQKTLVYLLAGNTAELLVMLVASLLGYPVPLLPLQLLWINLATDGLPALALVMDPPDADVLRRKPNDPRAKILGRAEWRTILATGALQAAVTLGVYCWAFPSRGVEGARNFAFTTLVFGEIFRAFASRSTTRLFWEVGAFTNLRLLFVVLVSAAVQIVIHHVPETRRLFGLNDITIPDCALSVAIGLVPVSVLETWKLLARSLRAA
jgi:Ca2+-transporting ATPase